MKAIVLLSQGVHPVSGKSCLPRPEAQAARLAAGLDPLPTGLHAGPGQEAVREALGRGLAHLTHLAMEDGADPVPALVAALAAAAPDLVLAGPRGQGGADTGLVPYALAHALGWPLVADLVALEPGTEPGTLKIEQALPKGARRRIVVRLPAVVTVHPGAPAPLPFAFGRARAGGMIRRAVATPPPAPIEGLMEKSYRKRPKVMGQAGGTAAERLAAVTGGGAGTGRVLVNPAPGEAAREIIAFLRGIGVLKARA
ncbi:electron transfer flavoprotein subunit beta [Azorhizobium doebereinerae]|uniref:electron transfer flavoprotein subunit beta n=1 Tax=Azorhizobium doebereinerae TaxID=281091 RepID=UPI0004193D55|nr:electron transfer flavoprotein subunit beta [Azorhizobium doebereinerae]